MYRPAAEPAARRTQAAASTCAEKADALQNIESETCAAAVTQFQDHMEIWVLTRECRGCGMTHVMGASRHMLWAQTRRRRQVAIRTTERTCITDGRESLGHER
jgi:ferredoxin-like protein FixX